MNQKKSTFKRRSKGQKIGTSGENAFRTFAQNVHLLPTKVSDDFGIDFICQVESDSNDISDIQGDVVGVAVRTTAQTRPRSKLNRSDAGNLLSCRFPVCVVLIHLGDLNHIYFRFIEGAFAAQLAQCLESSSNEITLTPSRLLDAAHFSAELERVLRFAHSDQNRMTLAERSLRQTIPHARLEVRRTTSGALTIVRLPDFLDQFELTTSESKHAAHEAVFGADALLTTRLSQLPLKRAALESLNELPNPIIFGGPVRERKVTLEVARGSTTAQCGFQERWTPGWWGFVHSTGLSLTVSDAVPHEGEMVHWFKTQLDIETPISLSKEWELFRFLEVCDVGSTLRIVDDQSPLPWHLDQFGEILNFGLFARYFKKVIKMHPWSEDAWLLENESRFEVLNTLAWLVSLADRSQWLTGFAFLQVGKAEGQLQKVISRMALPICANTARGGVVTWLDVDGPLYIENDHHVGLKVDRIHGFDLELRPDRFLKRSAWPELVLSPVVKPIELGPEVKLSESDATKWGYSTVILGSAREDTNPLI